MTLPSTLLDDVLDPLPLPTCAANAGSDYQLPGDPTKDIYIVPVSGGADSTWLAIVLSQKFPNIHFHFVFTDTLAEDVEIGPSLDRLETFLGRRIDRITPTRGLYELIDHYNGYLPSAQARWCTRSLKLLGFQHWLNQFAGKTKWVFVGVRADESSRIAFTIDECNTEMPFIDMGVTRAQVFAGLQRTIGIPRFYSRRTRSGCGPCPFQRRSEIVGLLQEQPVEFRRGMSYEKVSQDDLKRHEAPPTLTSECGLTRNHMSLPLPAGDSLDGRVRRGSAQDLFGNAGVFVGAEFFYDGFPGYEPFIWAQRLVSFSPTLHGIRRQLQDRYEHLLSTAEVFDMTPDGVRADCKFAIYYIEAPNTDFDPTGPSAGGYTWHEGNSYAQIQHIMGWAERVLHAHQLHQDADLAERVSPISWTYERAVGSQRALENISRPIGRVINSAWYTPTEPVDDGEFDERFVACPTCQI